MRCESDKRMCKCIEEGNGIFIMRGLFVHDNNCLLLFNILTDL